MAVRWQQDEVSAPQPSGGVVRPEALERFSI